MTTLKAKSRPIFDSVIETTSGPKAFLSTAGSIHSPKSSMLSFRLVVAGS
jgi:hypothetical protein